VNRIIKTALLCLLFISSSVFAEQGTKIYTEAELQNVRMSFLKSAIDNNDYATQTSLAVSFYATSKSNQYKGDRKALRNESLQILSKCASAHYVPASFFLITNFLRTNVTYAQKVARELILYAENDKHDILYDPNYYSSVMLYVSTILDSGTKDPKTLNFAINALEALPQKNAKTSFYTAFLFKNLGSYSIASSYLNDACHKAKPGGNIYKYCAQSSNVDRVDQLVNKVENSKCVKDISRRCK